MCPGGLSGNEGVRIHPALNGAAPDNPDAGTEARRSDQNPQDLPPDAAEIRKRADR